MGNASIQPLSEDELKEISKKTSISVDEIKKVYEEFEEIVYLDQEGNISKDSFSFYCFFDKRYRAKVKNLDLFVDQLFQAFDRDNSGSLSFHEFLVGKRLFESDSNRDNLKFFFRLFDLSKDKRIEKNEIELFLDILGRVENGTSNAEFAQAMLDDLDFDHNGSIDEDEFIEGILNNEKYNSLLNSIRNI